jgi:CRP-like cAMP-binding protein
MDALVATLGRTEFFAPFGPQHLRMLASCATQVQYEAGEFLSHSGDEADAFWLVHSGHVGLSYFVPARGEVTVATVTPGEVAGFSWLFPPHETRFDIVAVTPVSALRFDGRVVRRQCAADPEFGYQVMARFIRIIADRVEAMNLQLLDVFGHHPIEHQ